MERSVEVIEHRGEVRLRLRAASFGELAAAAGTALGKLELGGETPLVPGAWREITTAGRDREALLVNWLNELIYCAETERWVGTEFAPMRETDTELVMRVRGVTVDTAPSQVKAATLYGLRITSRGDGVEADLVLDV
jgi:SHS2 domain-containing protein